MNAQDLDVILTVRHLSRCPVPCHTLFASVQINMKVHLYHCQADRAGRTRVPVQVSQCLSLLKNGFGGYICCSSLRRMGRIRFKLIRTARPRSEHEGEPTRTASWPPQELWVPVAAERQGRRGPATEANREKGGNRLGNPAPSEIKLGVTHDLTICASGSGCHTCSHRLCVWL